MNEQLGPLTLWFTVNIPEHKLRMVYEFVQLFYHDCPDAYGEGITKAQAQAIRWRLAARH